MNREFAGPEKSPAATQVMAMNQICIGIPVPSGADRLRVTLESLRAHVNCAHRLVLLPDGPDASTTEFLSTLSDLAQSGTREPKGRAACFNRLITASGDADVLILLESGASVGPGWLDHLLAALDRDPRNGLAGPSTNRSWNEQCVYPQSGSHPEEIAATARDAARRFGAETRTLEPLFSLAEFCYVVKREVLAAIGGADQAYGLGPCWEMDYNIRAARAGWRGVWACAAYVHRAPATARRRLAEAQYFEASKHLYQNKFCGARLRHEKSDYRSHCRGDACPNFAPPDLIRIKQDFTPPVQGPAPAITELAEVSPLLVTCIMPTYNRRRFVPQAIRRFLSQDYSNLELLIVDDGTDPVSDCVPENDRIRYLRLDSKLTIGAKRNFACEHSRGEFIVHWDDDDWYPAWRVTEQVKALQSGAELCGSSHILYYEPATDRAWEYRYPEGNGNWVAGNTLAYRKPLWEASKFPEMQIGEDSRFVWSHAQKVICDLDNADICVATIHPGNTSVKDLNGSFWRAQARDRLNVLGDDVYFYRSANPESHVSLPLVSCIMPTFNRRAYVQRALDSFLQQDYPNRELVIIDDGYDAIEDLAAGVPNVRYVRMSSRSSIGAKRNLAAQCALGEIIAHWDDDDWYAPDRLRYQVAPILADVADITGLDVGLVLDLPTGAFWTVDASLHRRLFVGNIHGGTLVYRRELLAQGLRYPEVNLAEDAWLLRAAMSRGKRLLRLSNPGVFVYVRHGGNAWREFSPGYFIDPSGWQRIPPPEYFSRAALSFYQTAARNSC